MLQKVTGSHQYLPVLPSLDFSWEGCSFWRWGNFLEKSGLRYRSRKENEGKTFAETKNDKATRRPKFGEGVLLKWFCWKWPRNWKDFFAKKSHDRVVLNHLNSDMSWNLNNNQNRRKRLRNSAFFVCFARLQRRAFKGRRVSSLLCYFFNKLNQSSVLSFQCQASLEYQFELHYFAEFSNIYLVWDTSCFSESV